MWGRVGGGFEGVVGFLLGVEGGGGGGFWEFRVFRI